MRESLESLPSPIRRRFINPKMNPEIRSLLPAPGWRALMCAVTDEKIFFDEIPLLGWAVTDDGNVIPLAWDHELGAIDIRDDIETTSNAAGRILEPGETI